VQIVTMADRPELRPQLDSPGLNPGPKFIYHDPTARRWWGQYEAAFPDFRIAMVDEGDRVVAHGGAIPLSWPAQAALPDAGWDFVLEQGMLDHQSDRVPTIASALWIFVAEDRRGERLSSRMVSGLRSVTGAHGLESLIAPVRPTHKARYPLIAMDDYMTWADDRGAPFDPWLRVHWQLGGRIEGACARSMTIPGTVREWEQWSGLAMPASGLYVVPGGLTTVDVDLDADTAVYIEPNVWVRHDVSARGHGPNPEAAT
jgi:hypothetical protein